MLLDERGLIVSKTWDGKIDGGDSLGETSRISFLKSVINSQSLVYPDKAELLAPIEKNYIKFLNLNGQWVRNSTDWNDPKDTSRDQEDPLMMALSQAPGCSLVLHQQFLRLIKNFFRYQNEDVASPEHIGHFFRHKKTWWRPFYFYFSDLFMLLNSVIICYWAGYPTIFKDRVQHNIQNDINHMASLIHAQVTYPTLISRAAAIWYISDRPVFDDAGKKVKGNGWEYVLERYYQDYTGNGDLKEYYRKCLLWLINAV